MLSDVHSGLELPRDFVDAAIVRGKYEFYHYNVDGFDDRGWGCGYRTLQTICSWVGHVLEIQNHPVPSLQDIQKTLVKMGDKPDSFVGSREWIGCVEACLYMDQTFGVCSKIIHVLQGESVEHKAAPFLLEHFKHFGSPVMIGGDVDASSKTLLGVCKTNKAFHFLIADPHFYGEAAMKEIQDSGWVQWKSYNDVFKSNSFYNFCLPQFSLGED
ncbi:hypothetical protein pdam_00020477 [Pocillopora damicornis]|uniref:UFSP1/2/DUB catalytic domain-containing protein n=1 Tax=Pocillopora damicornis TaxID=46731 RepID=A0A3M6TPT3_POCDA|nr:ufm1-specific protease 1-like [Pocillopora damicornis]RMX43359.1 hypothetical protein pdam_00020477 [Pocillopora damicornis]